MIRRNTDTCAVGTVRHNVADRLGLLNDALLAADIMAGTVIGYLSAGLYFRLACHLSHIPSIGMVIWRELVLASVIASLVIRKTDHCPDADAMDVLAVLGSVLSSALCAGTALIAIGVVTGALNDFARAWIFIWAVSFVSWMVTSRLAFLVYRRRLAARGELREAIALIGTPAATGAVAQQLEGDVNIVGVFDHPNGTDAMSAVSEIVELARSGAIGLVVLAIGADEPAAVAGRIVDQLKAAPVQVAVATELAGLDAELTPVRAVGGIPMAIVAERPLSYRASLVKSVIDKVGAASLLMLTAPLITAIALAIALEMNGPILFRQGRTGWCGRTFTVLKFRTMWHITGAVAPRQTSRGDPRCTPIGSFLRRTSLDELPQLWNVLRGDMSLVGPRPHADSLHACELADAVPIEDYLQRQRVKPGLTGWAQVNGYRGATDTPEKLRRRVELDLYYIDHWSLWLDIRILALTPKAIFSAENAF